MDDPFAAFAASTTRTALVAGERRAVRMSRRYPTDVADLWSACTDPERTARWLGLQRGEQVEGGTIDLVMEPPDDIATLAILRCRPPHHLRVRWSLSGETASIVDLRLEPIGDAETCLTLEHLARTEELVVEYGSGWEDFLLRLLRHLGSGDQPPSGDVQVPLALWREVPAAPDDRWPVLDGGTVDAAVVVEATAADVWRSLTDVDALSAWFGATEGDLRLGGSWSVSWDTGTARGTVTACAPGERFTTTWRWDHEPDRPAGNVTVGLRPVAGGTRVEVVDTAAAGNPVGYGAGWYAHLGSIAAYASGGVARPGADWASDWEAARTVLRPLRS